jgi:TIR domain-containing protein
MPTNNYTYTAFISYSSLDRGWALKLADALTAADIEVFIDRQRLEAGTPWERQLSKAVEESQHLVVLWSNNAKQSDWVNRELGRFDAMLDSGGSQLNQPERRLIFVSLENQNTAFSSTQMIDDIREAGAYAAGADAIAPELWNRVVCRLVDAIRSDDSSLAIPVAVLTMSDTELDQIPADAWTELCNQLNVNKNDLKDRYSPDRADWRPFGSAKTVSQILANVKAEIEKKEPNAPRIRWEFVKSDFWDTMDAAREYAATKFRDISLVVIDPISLYNFKVLDRAHLLKEHCFENDKCGIMVLPPFAMPPVISRLRDLLENRTIFESYYMPSVPSKIKSMAQYSGMLTDEKDIKRLFLATLGLYVMKGQPTKKPDVLSV